MTSATSATPAPPDGPWLTVPAVRNRPPDRPDGGGGSLLPAAVLFDRDGTLVEDVPYNGDPARVRLMPYAREALGLLRELDIPVGVVSNQSGVARGLLFRSQVKAVQCRIEELLGPFGVWAVCPHGPAGSCCCRKPAPGLVYAACRRLGVEPERTVVIGDIGADMAAARAAGARGVLVPTPVTRAEEIAEAPLCAGNLLEAVRAALGPGGGPPAGARTGTASSGAAPAASGAAPTSAGTAATVPGAVRTAAPAHGAPAARRGAPGRAAGPGGGTAV